MVKLQAVLRNILVLFIGALSAVILAEAIVRLFPYKFAQYLHPCEVALKKDKDLGFLLPLANQRTTACKDCYRIYPIVPCQLNKGVITQIKKIRFHRLKVVDNLCNRFLKSV